MTDDIGPKALGLPKVVSEPTSAPTLLSLKSGPKSHEGGFQRNQYLSIFPRRFPTVSSKLGGGTVECSKYQGARPLFEEM